MRLIDAKQNDSDRSGTEHIKAIYNEPKRAGQGALKRKSGEAKATQATWITLDRIETRQAGWSCERMSATGGERNATL